jgi:hypothetical protein
VDISGYTREQLSSFQTVLDSAMTEAAERDMEIPLGLMAKRLFQAAGNGVRDFEGLKSAILGRVPLPPPLPVSLAGDDARAPLRYSL